MSYCEAHSYQHEIVSGCPRCLDNKRCLQIGELVMDDEVKDAEIAALRIESSKFAYECARAKRDRDEAYSKEKAHFDMLKSTLINRAKIEVLREVLSGIDGSLGVTAQVFAEMKLKALEATK